MKTWEEIVTEMKSVTRIPGFNKESDVYIIMREMMMKDRKILSIVRPYAVEMLKDKSSMSAKRPLIRALSSLMTPELIMSVVSEYNKDKGLFAKLMISDSDAKTPRMVELFANTLARGIIDSLLSDPLDHELVSALGKKVSELADDHSVARGKSKMGVMMKNRSKR